MNAVVGGVRTRRALQRSVTSIERRSKARFVYALRHNKKWLVSHGIALRTGVDVINNVLTVRGGGGGFAKAHTLRQLKWIVCFVSAYVRKCSFYTEDGANKHSKN
jgi:hypothetical protein